MRHGNRVAAIVLLVTATACGSIATETSANAGAKSEAAARIGKHTISMSEVDARARAENVQVFQQLYDARRAALNGLVEDYLLEQEAKARGISKDKLVAEEIDSKTGAVTDAEIESFYKENQARMGGRSLEQVRDQIQQFLVAGKARAARDGFLSGLKDKSAVAILLEPPRAEVVLAANDPRKGPAKAPIVIVEYSDFQ